MAGKLSPDQLKRFIFPYQGAARPEIATGPGIGEDAAVIENNGRFLYISSDPIVGAVENVGSLLVDINVNDIAVKGGDPQYLILTLLVPETLGLEYVHHIMQEIHTKAMQYNIAIIGGHTEITTTYDKPVVSATIIGEGPYCLSCEHVAVGDVVLLIGEAALEGCHIIYSSKPDLFGSILTTEEQTHLASLKDKLCIYPYTRIIRDHVLFMHDPTEGGIHGGISELASLLPNKGIELHSIAFNPLVQKMTSHIGARPEHLISSGALLAIVRTEKLETVASLLNEQTIPWQQIGTIADTNNFVLDASEDLWKYLE